MTNITLAKNIAREMRNIFDDESRTARERHLETCRLFHSVDDDDVYRYLSKQFPGMDNYDSHGRFIGQVKNENGWTA